MSWLIVLDRPGTRGQQNGSYLRGKEDPSGTQLQAWPCPAADSGQWAWVLPGGGWQSLTICGAASFRRRGQLVGIWGTVGFQTSFPLLLFFLIVHSAATWMWGEKGGMVFKAAAIQTQKASSSVFSFSWSLELHKDTGPMDQSLKNTICFVISTQQVLATWKLISPFKNTLEVGHNDPSLLEGKAETPSGWMTNSRSCCKQTQAQSLGS
jgi:hypothetical protein